MFHETISSVSGAEGLQMSHVSQIAGTGLPALPETSYKLLAPHPGSRGLSPHYRGCCLPLPCKKGAESLLGSIAPLRVSSKSLRPHHSFPRRFHSRGQQAPSLQQPWLWAGAPTLCRVLPPPPRTGGVPVPQCWAVFLPAFCQLLLTDASSPSI